MSGRAVGYCAGSPGPGYATAGRGFRGRGRAWARGGWLFGPARMPVETPERELDELKQQAQQLQSSLNQINNRIEQLQK